MPARSVVICADRLSKHYRLYTRKSDRLLEALDPFRRRRHREFPALSDVCFTVARGESVGLVGLNGSGKSTLLKLLCGVIRPSSGLVEVNGRISALLELGAGFHPERTGMENLYFQGAIQGFTRQETEAMIPDILAFADIGEFIHQPVKVYSSGMFVRLAFAAAVQVRPDILVVDEALSVGDARFQRRCFARIEEMKQQGVTFVLVSHSMEQIVTHCRRALLLSKGTLIMDGEPRDVVNRYLDMLFGKSENAEHLPKVGREPNSGRADPASDRPIPSGGNRLLELFLSNRSTEDRYHLNPLYNRYEYRWGNRQAAILDVYIESDRDIGHILPGDCLSIHVKSCFYQSCFRPIWGCTIKTREGVTVYGTNTEINGGFSAHESIREGEPVYVSFSFRCDLAPGEYFVSLGLAVDAGNTPLDRRFDSLLLVVHGPANFFGLSNLHMDIKTSF